MTADDTVYGYVDEAGNTLFEVVRKHPKRFAQRVPLGSGLYEYKLNGVRRVPYRLPKMRAAIEVGRTIFVVEGEKDAEALLAIGFIATTNAQGAGWQWTTEFAEHFRGAKRVVFIADCDVAGRRAVNARALLLKALVDDVRLLDLAHDRDDGYDISDWLAEGHTATELKTHVEITPRVAGESSANHPSEHLEWNDARPWPTLDAAALHGLAGDFVRLVAPHSEADLSALLSQFLCAFGSGIGPSAHVLVEATQHSGRLNVLLVGETAGGRKGTAMGQVDRIFRIADEAWMENAHISGLASGEGLIARLRDRDEGEPIEKRVLVIEPEFVRTLAAGSRDGSILGAVIRDAWDSGRLQNLTRKEPLIAKGCHVGIIGHITADELRAKLSTTDIANGFVNRFIIVCVRRRQRLPHGGALSECDLAPIAKRLRTALDFARQLERVRRTPAANLAWEAFYNAVPEPDGLLGAVTARAEAQVLRLSLLYALLDGSISIDVPHLRAAEALWRYAHTSAQHVFGSKLGDDVADRVLAELRASYPASLDRKELHDLFSRHITSNRLSSAIEQLARHGLAATELVKTDGRPRECIRALPCVKSELSAISPPDADLSSHNTLNSQPRERGTGAGEPAPFGSPPVSPVDETEARL